MEKYAKWKPTGFDAAGLGLDDRQDWLVVGVMQTRDSGCLERSNFECTVRALENEAGPEGYTGCENDPDDGHGWEIHRFGHWGPGWFEIILVRPGSLAEKTAASIESGLADYPIVDDEHFSMLESDEKYATWAGMSLRDRVSECARHRTSIFAARRTDMIPEQVYDALEVT